MLDIRARDLRDFTDDRHRTVDDVPFGGGPGMVMKPEPMVRAVEAIAAERGPASAVVLMTPQGRPLHARRGGAAEPDGSAGRDLRTVRGRRRAGRGNAGHRRDFDRRLRADRRRAAGAGARSTRWRGWCRAWSATRSRWPANRSAAGLLDHPHYTRPARLAWPGCRRCCCRGITPRSTMASRSARERRDGRIGATRLDRGTSARGGSSRPRRCELRRMNESA